MSRAHCVEIGAFEAKTRLSELLREVDHGATYLITRHGRPVARLSPPDDLAAESDLASAVAICREIRARSRGSGELKQLITQGRKR